MTDKEMKKEIEKLWRDPTTARTRQQMADETGASLELVNETIAALRLAGVTA